MAKYRYQQQYHDRLRRQQVSWSTRSYNYYNDPYYYTPNRYRYLYRGNWQRTNRYGADLIRQAINYGYQEGLYAGSPARQKTWLSDYRDSYAYKDANHGNNGYSMYRTQNTNYLQPRINRVNEADKQSNPT